MHDLTTTRDPVGLYHGAHVIDLAKILCYFHDRTPGIYFVTAVTIALPSGDLIQPDLAMFVHGARCSYQKDGPDGRVRGHPQIAVDVDYDLDEAEEARRMAVYGAGGVQECLFNRIRGGVLRWYRNQDGRMLRIEPDDAGIIRSTALPGLWISVRAIQAGEGNSQAWAARARPGHRVTGPFRGFHEEHPRRMSGLVGCRVRRWGRWTCARRIRGHRCGARRLAGAAMRQEPWRRIRQPLMSPALAGDLLAQPEPSLSLAREPSLQ